VKHDPAYGGREMHYQAIGAAALFAETDLRDDEVVQVRCRDGFVASLSKERIMRTGPGQSIAYNLNLPLNPTEYFKESVLPRYIRDPKSIRSWEGSKMPGFGPQAFSDEDIANVVAYLNEMAFEKSHAD